MAAAPLSQNRGDERSVETVLQIGRQSLRAGYILRGERERTADQLPTFRRIATEAQNGTFFDTVL